MKKILRLFKIILLLFLLSACHKTPEVEISFEITIDESISKDIQVGGFISDFRPYFIITDSLGKRVDVTNDMIDSSEIIFTKAGSYVIKLNFNNQTKNLIINVIEQEPEIPEEPEEPENPEEPDDQNINSSDLFFSEYCEGSGNNKYLEIFNGTGETIDLSKYKILLYTNGSLTPQSTLHLNGKLKDGETYLIYNTSSVSEVSSVGDISHPVTNFNGNDFIALYNEDKIIDVIGVYDEKVEEGWDIGDIKNATKDHTLIRKSTINSPNNKWNPDEWSVLDCDDFSNIKMHQMDNYVPTFDEEPEIEDPNIPIENEPDLFISEYFEGGYGYTNSKYIEIYNGLEIDVDLSNYKIALYKDGAIIPSYIENLTGVIKSKEVYIVYAPYSVDEIKSKGHLASEVCFFNGKAAIALLKNDEIIDVIGVIGEYPEKGWPVDETTTTIDNTLIRKESVVFPSKIWDPLQWYVCYENYLYGLGNHYFYQEEDYIYEDFDEVFELIKQLKLNDKGTAISDEYITVIGTVYMDVVSETKLVYLTDGFNIIKLYGEKIHNYTTPGRVYEIKCYYKSHIYQPTLEVIDPTNDIKVITDKIPITEIETLEVSLQEITNLKRENFANNIENGYLKKMLKVTAFLQLDTHNSTTFDYCLTEKETYSKNNTGYILNSLYFKNKYGELSRFLSEYEVIKGSQENAEITVYGVIYEWNTNRKNWYFYIASDLTKINMK